MQAIKTIKMPLEVNEEDARILHGQSKICNWLYNTLLNHALSARKQFIETQDPECAKTVYTKRGLRNLIPSLKLEFPFLKSVYSSPLKNVGLRLSDAIQAHQKGKKGKRKGLSGWPKFRSWQVKWFSLLYDEPGKGFKVSAGKITLSLGVTQEGKRLSCTLSLKEPLDLSGEIRTLRIIYENGIFYALFTVSVTLPVLKKIEKVIAFDPNHKNFAYGVDLEGNAIEIAAPHWLKTFDKRLDELKSLRDCCVKKAKTIPVFDLKGIPTGKTYTVPSRNWKKRNETLQRLLRKRQEQTKTFMYTLAHRLCRHYDCIAIGDYTPDGSGLTKQMRRAMNNRSLIGRFKEIVNWTAQKSGKLFIEYDEKNTTRGCSHCAYCHPISLCPSIRIWKCPECQTEHIRDENAAKNGLKRVLRNLREKYETNVSLVSGSDLVSVVKQWAWSVLPSRVVATLRGQNCAQAQLQEIKLEA